MAGNDGWVQLHPADLVLARTQPIEPDTLEARALAALTGTGAFLFRQLSAAVSTDEDEPPLDADLATALWNLVWAGHVSNDTYAPVRTVVGRGGTHRNTRPAPRARLHGRGRGPRAALQGPPTASGRWFALDTPPVESTADRLARTEALLGRYGVVTRGSVMAEQTPGGFAAVYRVLRELEQTGACLRGYFVESLGAAQFAAPATIDRLRGHLRDDDAPSQSAAIVLAATDPAQPFGAALPWPDRLADDAATGHRPARKAGAMAVLHDGRLVAYLERGGKTLLPFDDDPTRIAAASAGPRGSGARPAHRSTHDRDHRRAPGVGHPVGRSAARGRIRPHPQGSARRCLRATPSGGQPSACAQRWQDQELVSTDFRVPQHATLDLSGAVVTEVLSRGKHLLIRAGGHSIHTHLKMEGVWHVHPIGTRWRRPDHMARIVLRTARRTRPSASRSASPRCVPTERESEVVGHLGPDLLGPDWDLDEATRRVSADPGRSVFLALLDQRNLAGLGNEYVNELLFISGLHPERSVGDLPDVRRVIARGQQMLDINKDRPQRTFTGNTRSGQERWVYRRERGRCRRCGTPIRTGQLGDQPTTERNTFWCPACQPPTS